jgi:hypothetical protein
MDESNRPRMSTAELLGATWRVWCSHAGMFILLMGIPVAGDGRAFERQPLQMRQSQTHNKRSNGVNFGRFLADR